jgi:predicted  nucleic acid-binding Zn-ribbon protein
MPVVPPPVPGFNPQAQMGAVIEKTNECINRWNYIQANCFKALNDCVGAAKTSPVYYDDCEVHLEQGYSSDDSAVYHIVRVNKFDKAGCPIRVKLGLAYDNSTNSNVRQSMHDYSFVKSANVIMTAVNPSQQGWNGPAMWRGMAIAGTPNADGYIAGFTAMGTLKVYKGTVESVNLCQDKIVDMIGGVTPIILDGEITEQAKELTTKKAITAIGYNSGCGQTILFNVGITENPGMQGITVASILKEMGCNTAVITAMQDATDEPSIGMEYLGRWTDVPAKYNDPQNVAFWYVSKRPECGFKNDFETEIANLVQSTGYCANGITELRDKVENAQETADEALSLAQDNADKIATIQGQITEIYSKIDALDTRLTKVEGDITTIKGQIDTINQQITTINQAISSIREEISDLTEQIAGITSSITNLTNRVQTVEGKVTTIEGNISDIQGDITNIEGDITNINNALDDIKGGTTELPYVKKAGDTMSGALNMGSNKVSAVATPTDDADAATKKYVDDKVSGAAYQLPVAGPNTLGGVKVGTGLNITSDGTLSATGGGGETGDYLPLAGGTMSGDIVMSEGTAINLGSAATGSVYNDNGDVAIKSEAGKVLAIGSEVRAITPDGSPAKVTNVADATESGDAVNKGQMDDELDPIRTDISEIETNITNIKNGTDALPYVKKSGDTMTGTLNIIAGVNNRLMFGTNMGLSADESEQEITMANGVGNITLAGKDINFNPATVDGVIRCNDRPIKQVADPTDAQDVATKAYVDANSGGGVEGGFLGNGWTLIQSWNISTEASPLTGITQDLLSKITEIAFIVKLDANQTYSGPFTIDTSNNVADHIYLGNIATQAPALTFALKYLINDKSFNNAGELSCVIINNASSGVTNAASLNKLSIIRSLAADVKGTIDIYWR